MKPTSALMGLALRRHGVFTLAEAHSHGVTRSVLARLVRTQEVVRCHAAVYRFVVVPVTPQQRIYAAVRAAETARRRAFASHTSAGLLLGLPGVLAGRPEVTVASTTLPLIEGVRVHRCRALPDGDVTAASGVPCSVGSRAVAECAATMADRRRIELVDAAIFQRVTTRHALHARALRCTCMRGRATILRITRPDAEGPFWSEMERAFARGVKAHALPAPRYNVALPVRGRRRIIDALFDPCVGVDVHGLRFHSSPQQVREDAERVNLATELGLDVLVFTWDQVLYDFGAVAERIRAAVAAAHVRRRPPPRS